MTSVRASLLLLLAAGCASPSSSPEAERRTTEMEKQIAELRDRVDTLTAVLVEHTGDRFGPATVCPPAIDAEVLEVKHDLKLVVLNKGSKDEVKVGYVFDLYLRSTYKGQVRIQEVQETTCSGLILHEINPIARGDAATTSL